MQKRTRKIASRPRETFYDPLVRWESAKHFSIPFRDCFINKVSKQTNTYWNGAECETVSFHATHPDPCWSFLLAWFYYFHKLHDRSFVESNLSWARFNAQIRKQQNIAKSFFFPRTGKNLARLLNNSGITQPLNMIWLHSSSYAFTSSSIFSLLNRVR